MFNTLVSRVGVVTKGCPNPTQLVGRDTGSHATATNEHASIGLAELYRLPNQPGIYREVHRIGAVRSQICYLVSLFLEEPNNIHFQRIARVVGADCNTHSASKSKL
jgi:hypothetical protein